LTLALFGACEALAEAPAIEYAYPEQSVWTTKLDDQGAATTPLLGLADKLFAKTGMKWHASPYPAKRMYKVMQEGGANFSMLVGSPTLDHCCLIGERSVAATELRVYHSESTPAVQTIDELKGKRLIVVSGYTYGSIAPFLDDTSSSLAIIRVASHEAAFAMLAAKRGDYLIDYVGPAREILEKRPLPGLRSERLAKLEVRLVLSKDYPDAEAMLKKLDTAAAGLPKVEVLDAP